ncbi:hypothetical protein P879_02564 [Paragonimus westermani]|uniref:Uncharacterized protein n=1 Tax=Paragonimus westermani TaxID=34504 RepID=A0A8T0DNG0_9TREM|nr:hypothetical protein P879_02564 [Paragonimus westermani]
MQKKLTDAQDKITTQRENRRRLRGNILHCEMQLEELNTLMEIVKQRLHTASLHMEKATRTVEDSKQRYVRAERMLSQLMERLNRFFRTNQPDIEARILKHFNRLAYMFYEKCLKTSSVPAEELLAVERQIAESLNLRKPSVLSFRLSQHLVPAKQGELVLVPYGRTTFFSAFTNQTSSSH